MQKMKGKEKKLVRGKEQCWIGISADCIRRMKESRLAAMICSCSYTLPVSSSSTWNSANCSSVATPTQAPQEKTLFSLSLAQRQCFLLTTVGYISVTHYPNRIPVSAPQDLQSVLTCEVKYLLKSYLLTVVPCF